MKTGRRKSLMPKVVLQMLTPGQSVPTELDLLPTDESCRSLAMLQPVELLLLPQTAVPFPTLEASETLLEMRLLPALLLLNSVQLLTQAMLFLTAESSVADPALLDSQLVIESAQLLLELEIV